MNRVRKLCCAVGPHGNTCVVLKKLQQSFGDLLGSIWRTKAVPYWQQGCRDHGMTYRVTFMERTNGRGQPSEFPPDYVAIDLPDGVVLDKVFIERTEPEALHSEENLEEDDSFLSVGSETWDYEVADGRDDDFIAALKNSQMVMEYVLLDEETQPAVRSSVPEKKL